MGWIPLQEAQRKREAQQKYGPKKATKITEAQRLRLVEGYQTLGLSEEEAMLASRIHGAVVEGEFQRLYEAGLAMGLSQSEARAFASRR